MTRPVFADSVFFAESVFLLTRHVIAESVLLSQFLLTKQHDSVRKRTIYV